MAGYLREAAKTISMTSDYCESKRSSYKDKNTEDALRHISAIAGILVGIWTVAKLILNLFNKN